MPIKDVTGEASTPKFLGVFYGPSGAGKTNLATAYPDSWGRGLYFALDPDAWRLDSVLEKYRGRLDVLKFEGGDPITNMNDIVTTDWSKQYPEAGVIIIDTLSVGAKAMLQDSANKNYFKSKDGGDGHVKFGPKDAAITQSIPGLQDYGGAKWLVENWLIMLTSNLAPKYHVIVLCHEDYDAPRKGDQEDVYAIGGPATFGRKLLSEFPVYFPTIVRLRVDHKTDLSGKTVSKYVAVAAQEGAYIARIREGFESGNPMPRVVVPRDARPWWDEYETKIMKGGK